MPRAADGTYTLPAGNPVVENTDIEATWANNTLDDIADALTDSLSRSGEGGMLVPLLFADGEDSAPGIAWEEEPSTGLYRAGANDMRLAVAGVDKVRWTAGEVMEFNIADVWTPIEDIGGSGPVSIESRSIAYTFVLDDAQTLQVLTGSTDRTWVIPPNSSVAFDLGTCIALAATDAALTIDPDTGVTITSLAEQDGTNNRIVLEGGMALLVKLETNHWLMTGDMI